MNITFQELVLSAKLKIVKFAEKMKTVVRFSLIQLL